MIKEFETPVFILAGGFGTRISEETIKKPKPMVEIGGIPIILHIINYYMRFGFRKFIICTGYKYQVINSFFSNFKLSQCDFSVNLNTGNCNYYDTSNYPDDLTVTCCFTGNDAMTGTRIYRATKKFLGNSKNFAVTYGDGLTNANLSDEFVNHQDSKKLATILSVRPPSRFGEFKKSKEGYHFQEKPHTMDTLINGGYFFFRREFLDKLNDDNGLILEQQPLVELARENELNLYVHNDFWQCMDTLRDKNYLETLYQKKEAPWIDY